MKNIEFTVRVFIMLCLYSGFENLAHSQQQYTFSKSQRLFSSNDQINLTNEEDFGNDITLSDSLIVVAIDHVGTDLRYGAMGPSSSVDNNNAAVLVFDDDGNYRPQKSVILTGAGEISAQKTLLDSQGNLIISGSFSGGSMQFDLEELTQSGAEAAFVIVYDVNGDYLWGRVFQSSDITTNSSLSLDSQDNIIVGGQFSGSGLSLGTNTYASEGGLDGYIVSMDSDGNILWSYQFGGDQEDQINDIYVTPEDSVLVGASFNSTSVTIDGQTENTTGGFEAVAMVFDAAGSLENYAVFNSTLNVNSSRIIGDGQTWYLAVKHRGLLFGNNPANNHDDIQIIKYENNAFVWNQLIRSTKDEEVTDMVLLENGNLIVIGNTKGFSLVFDLLAYQGTADQEDIFLFEMNPSNQLVRAFRDGNDFADDQLKGIVQRAADEFWAIGNFQGSALVLSGDTIINTDPSGSTNDIWFSRMYLNNLPQGVNISSNTVDENLVEGSLIGTLSASDPDLTDTHVFFLDPLKEDNAEFKIVNGNELVTDEVFDFELKSSYALKVDVLDDKGGIVEADLSILITNVNELPTDLHLSDTVVNESSSRGTLVGVLTTIDPDNHQSGFTYTLVNGEGDDDNARFYTLEDKLYLASEFDFEVQQSASVRIQTDDGQGGFFSKAFLISVIDNIISAELSTLESGISTFGGSDQFYEIVLDNEGNRYVHGNLGSQIIVEGDTLSQGPFIASYDASLNLRWIKSSIGSTRAMVVTGDKLYQLVGSSIRTYNKEDGEYIGFKALGSTYAEMAILNDTIFVVKDRLLELGKFSLEGNFSETVLKSNVQGILVTDLHVDDNQIYVSFRNSINGNITVSIDGINISSFGTKATLLSFNHDLELVWFDDIFQTGGTTLDGVTSDGVELGPDGTIYLFGENFSDNAIGSRNAGSTISSETSFIARYQDDGSLISLQAFSEAISNLQIDQFSNQYVVLDVGDIEKYSAGGSVLWTYDNVEIADVVYDGTALTGVGDFTGLLSFNNLDYNSLFESDAVILNFDQLGTEAQSSTLGNPGGNHGLYALGEPYGQNIRAIGSLRGALISGSDTLKSSTEDILIMDYSIGDEPSIQATTVVGFVDAVSPDAIVTDEIGNSLIWDEGEYTDGDNYLVKIDDQSNTVWIREYGIARISDAIFTDNGDIYITALYRSGEVTIDGTTFTTNGSSANNSLVIKLDADGFVQWVKGIDGSSWVTAKEIVADQNGVYVAGYFSGSLSINSDALTVETPGIDEVFILKLDHDGNSLFTKKYAVSSENYRFNDELILNGNFLYLHNRNANTAKEEILRTDLQGVVDEVYLPPFENFSHFDIKDGKIYLSQTSEGRNLVLDLNFNLIQQYPTSTSYYGDIEIRQDTIYSLNNNLLTLSVIQSGPEGFSLEADDFDENFTGFVSKLIPEISGIVPNYSTSNGAFSISNDSLFVTVLFDHESLEEIEIPITFTDVSNQTITRNFLLSINDLNEPPKDIVFTKTLNQLRETDPMGTAVGTVSATDLDEFDTALTLTIEDSLTATRFYIDGDTVRTQGPIDFEAISTSTNAFSASVSLILSATDGGGLSLSKAFTFNEGVTLLNLNEFPTSIDTLVREERTEFLNQSTFLGSTDVIDPDFTTSFRNNSYFVVDSIDDGQFFDVFGFSDQINVTASTDTVLNFESDSLFNLTVGILTPGFSLDTVYLPMVVKLTDANDPVTDITITGQTVEENLPAGTEIGQLFWEDEDADAVYDLQVANNTDGQYFEVVDSILVLAQPVDYESRQQLSATIIFDDLDDETFPDREEVFTISVTDVNEPPVFNGLPDTLFIDESSGAVFLTRLDVVDPETSLTADFSFTSFSDEIIESSLVNNIDSELNLYFEDPNFEEKSIHSFVIEAVDPGGLTSTRKVVVSIRDVNEPFSGIKLSGLFSAPDGLSLSVEENIPIGTKLGKLQVDDEDTNPVFNNYEVTVSDGNQTNTFFQLDEFDSLMTVAELDREEFGAERNLVFRVEDLNTSASTIYTIRLDLLNVNEAPSRVDLSATSIEENSAVGSIVGSLSAVDPDGDTEFTYSVTSHPEFTVDGNNLVTAEVLDFEEQSLYTGVTIEVTDPEGLTFSSAFDITVVDVSEVNVTYNAVFAESIDENLDANTLIGQFQGASSYQVINTNPDFPDFDQVSVSNAGELSTTTSLNHEEQDSLRVLIEASASGISSTALFAIQLAVNDVNEAPEDITLSNAEIAENLVTETIIGVLTAVDQDEAESFTYAVVETDDFTVQGDALLSARSYDFGAEEELTATITVTDEGGLTFTKEVTVSILNDPSDDDEENVLGMDSSSELVVYPNPASQSFRLNNSEAIEVIIHSLDGRMVLTSLVPARGEIDISALQSGQYFIQVRKDLTLIKTLKIIKTN